MVKREVVITNSLGLHARPAAMLVKEANKYPCDIYIAKGDMKVNAKSIMGVLMLAAGKGSVVTLMADGERAEEALDNLERLIKSNFDEE
ncbi:TPA: HPr family phosphocarrier protein [Candidatus Poribacteria bacterium]|nr:HPr family phosphocarrier protein [Candidatus Poribacteria bacterium]